VNVPVVMNNPFSPRPAIAPLKSRTALAETEPRYPLALEVDREGYERTAEHTDPIEAAVTGEPEDLGVSESGFPPEALREPFERVGRHFQQSGEKDIAPIGDLDLRALLIGFEAGLSLRSLAALVVPLA
jgi:hypothetical protein